MWKSQTQADPVSPGTRPLPFPVDLDSELYTFQPSADGAYTAFKHGRMPWCLRDAFCGTQIFGMTGSGKTSGSGDGLARTFLKNQFGGLVLCHKSEELEHWEELARATGRWNDITVFSTQNQSRFNFLDFESKLSGGSTENLYRLFAVLAEVGERSLGGSPPDPFWKNALKELVMNSIELLKLAGKPVTLPNIEKVMASSPYAPELLENDAWKQNSFCFQTLCDAYERNLTASQLSDLKQTATYWLESLPILAPQTRSCVFAMFSGTAVSLMRGELREMFCEGDTNMDPATTLDGKIIVMGLPLKEYFEAGRYAQILYKYMWQRVIERRKTLPKYASNLRPQFLWADEAHNFFVSHDMEFQTTARSSRVATVYLTQNMENYRTVIPEANRDAIVNSFLGNMQTKIFHANHDTSTNEYASNQIGKRHFFDVSNSKQWEKKGFVDKVVHLGGADSESETKNMRYDFQVLPIEFAMLKRGGPRDGNIVEGFVSGGVKPGGKLDGIKKMVGSLDEDVGFIRAKFMQEKRAKPEAGRRP